MSCLGVSLDLNRSSRRPRAITRAAAAFAAATTMLAATAPILSLSALLDVDGKRLRDPSSSLATLVMFSSPSCEQCRAPVSYTHLTLPTTPYV